MVSTTTTRQPRALRAAARHPQVVDFLLGSALGGASLVAVAFGPRHDPGRPVTGLDVIVAVAAAVLIAFRRRWPMPVLAVATVGAAWATATDDLVPVLTAAALCALYTVASRTNRTTAWAAGAAAAVLFYLTGMIFADRAWDSPENLGVLAWTGLAVAVGDALRSRRAYVAAVEERAERAEQSREDEARRRVIEERLRIARELHDVVAHHIALINVQAGVAAHVLRTQPDQAEQALAHVRQASRTVLDELSTVLDVLRRDDDGPSTEPTPGLDRLTGLLDAVAAAGLRVEHRQDGDTRGLPSAVDLAAYRIVQESLTNAQKHGDGPTALLRLAYTPAGLSVLVENAAGRPTGEGAGHGLTGMRERAASVGGTLDARHEANGRFVVHAFLPAPALSAPAREGVTA